MSMWNESAELDPEVLDIEVEGVACRTILGE